MKKLFPTKRVNRVLLPAISMSSDWFKCASCGYTVMMRVLGNTAHCSQCGGTMHRK